MDFIIVTFAVLVIGLTFGFLIEKVLNEDSKIYKIFDKFL